jgi:RNA polymerase sigma factor (sigma-70 family)
MVVDLKAPITNLQGRSETTNKYLFDIRQYPVLNAEEERDIIARIKAGDESARRTLIESNQRFVFAVARKYAKDEHHLMDLVSEGNVGLIKAIDSFEPALGFKFITHAVWYIRREISSYIVNTDTLIRKTNISKTNTRLRRLNNEFFLKNGRTPSVDELKELFLEKYNIEIKNDTDLLELCVFSTDDSISDDSNDSVMDASSEVVVKTSSRNEFEETSNNEHMKAIINYGMDCLSSVEKTIVKMAFGIDCDREHDNNEIAEVVDYTAERVRQLKKKALEKMKAYIKQNKKLAM